LLAGVSFGSSATGSVQAQAAFSVSVACIPNPGQTGQTIICGATPANPPAATTTYLWFFGDGAGGIALNPATHQYTAPGPYTVTVQATSGAQVVSGSAIEVIAAALGVAISGPSTGVVGTPVTFTAAPATGATLPADTTFSWDFGDGSGVIPASTNKTVTHVFSTTGTFTVKVTASSATSGTTGTAQMNIAISSQAPATSVALTISGPSQATAGQQVTFSVTPGATVPSDIAYSWTFSDGTAATGASVNHTFSNPGNYTVSVSASSASTAGLSGQASLGVAVAAAGPSGGLLPAGWNLVAGPTGSVFSQCEGPLYTFQPGDVNYEQQSNVTPVTGGRGYWCFLTAASTLTLNGSSQPSVTITLPASQWVMVGNPSTTASLRITGSADAVDTWDTAGGRYATGVTTLAPGQGAWAISLNGGTITVGP
jgi:PKD repeat protein